MSLSTELLTSAKNEIQKSIITDLQRRITRAEGDAAANRQKIETNRRYAKQYTKVAEDAELSQPDLDGKVAQAKETLNVLLSAFGGTVEKAGPYQRFSGQLFHMDSKTGGKGHFMQVDANGNVKCTCTAAAFENECWAVKTIKSNLDRGNNADYGFYGGQRNFDARVRPASSTFRVPGYSSRTYNKYARLG